MTLEYSLTIPEDGWTADIVDSEMRLHAILVINGLAMHLEAWPVHVVGGLQEALDPEYADAFAMLHEAVSAEGHFRTLTIRGQAYVLVASPFC